MGARNGIPSVVTMSFAMQISVDLEAQFLRLTLSLLKCLYKHLFQA